MTRPLPRIDCSAERISPSRTPFNCIKLWALEGVAVSANSFDQCMRFSSLTVQYVRIFAELYSTFRHRGYERPLTCGTLLS